MDTFRQNSGPKAGLLLLPLLLIAGYASAKTAGDAAPAAGAGEPAEAVMTQSACAPRISFFPQGGEDRNIPSAWGKTAQMAAGNFREDQMFTVMLTSNNNLPGIAAGAVPVLHVQPVHPLLMMGASGLPAECTGFVARSRALPEPAAAAQQPQAPAAAAGAQKAQPTGAAGKRAETVETATDDAAVLPKTAPAERLVKDTPAAAPPAAPAPAAAAGKDIPGPAVRHLLQQQQQPPAVDSEVVTMPARYRLSYAINGSQPVEAGEFSMYTPVQRILLDGLRGYEDGYYCLSVKLTIPAFSGMMAGHIAVPPTDLWSTREVCFYKMDNPPTASAQISTCRETLAITFKNLKPQPVPLFPGSTRSLFHSVFQFGAALNRTKDWSWPSDATPKALNHWIVLSAGDNAGQAQRWRPEERVAEGWYNLKLEASLATDFPSLMALGSMPSIGKYADDAFAPPQLAEKPKLLTTPQALNGTVAGIQYVQTEFRSLTGPDDEVRYAVNDEMQLAWDFEGFGDSFCFIDGKLVHNSGEFNCRPPLAVQLPDHRNHTLKLVMQDVCNASHVVDASFGLWGYRVVRAPKPPAKLPAEAFAESSQLLQQQTFELGTQAASSTLRAPRATSTRARNTAAAVLPAGSVACWLLAAAVSAWWLHVPAMS